MGLLLLLVAVLPFLLVGAVRLAVRVLRFVRAHRGEVSAGLIIDELRGQFADALEHWGEDATSSGYEADHHHDATDHSPHDH